MQEKRYEQLKLAERGALISIVSYILLAAAKIIMAKLYHSAALQADGFNNLSDVIASMAVFIGLRLARQPADDDHRYGHWKVETVASLITSFLMFFIGIEVLVSAIKNLFNDKLPAPNPIAAYTGIASAIIMFGVYSYNHRLAKKVSSHALDAAAKDNLSDALTSLGTAIAIFASSFHLVWLDRATAVIIGIIILKTAWDIFRESAFSLSDGFSETKLQQYAANVLMIPGVKSIKDIRGRTYGANIFIDIVVYMDPNLTVAESHDITEAIETLLYEKFNVFDTDVHVEPFTSHTRKDV
ncbi:cation diffusion facilitator family transporter [Vagococcus lutrae]|uniref:cation diffusion facilitator family transporter n=1 Tax=Vagococcus lutrae TaxID=81947 RepID=UPI001C938DC4|nr:cation diffusion facilitator family transporter [Vagococcus lutrae]QZN88837.1 cation diffusion facilitator family transporter [Vagococcus lutrae]